MADGSLQQLGIPQPRPTAPRPARRLLTRQGWLTICGGALATLLILAAAAGVVWSNRQTQIAQWTGWASDLSLIVAEQTHQTIKSADLVLRAITERVQDNGIDTPEQFRTMMAGRDIYDILRQRAAGVPQIDVATVIALDGQIVNFSRWWPPTLQAPPFGPINLADRDYFQAQLQDPDLGTYISAPVQNRGTGTWTFYLSRKIKSKAGVLVGVGIIGLHVDFFSDFYKAIAGETDRTFSLFRNDGILLARWPPHDDFLGKSFRSGSVISLGLTTNSDHGATYTRTPRVTEPNDMRARITSPRRVAEYPLLVNSIIYDDEFLAAWRANTQQVAILAAALALVTMGLTVWLALLMSRQSRTMVELQDARHHAESAARAKTDFLAMMSHEIRTPINAIIGMSDAMLEAPLPERERKMARIVGDASTHLLTIVNTILDFSRLEAGHDHAVFVPFEVRRTVRSVLNIASSLPGASGLEITSHIGRDVAEWVIGDQGHITQVLVNLLGNAVKFTEEGGVDLTVSKVRGTPQDERPRLRFSVTDTGPGITAETASRLFEPFERGENWRTLRRGGTGLGLAISKRLVSLMGGEIGAEGEPGAGSVFWFEIPAEPTERPAIAAPEDRGDNSGVPRKLSILVAEDSETSQLVARHILESLGHNVTIAPDGKQALAAVQAADYDLVLMDGHMPHMNGLDATRAIRALGGKYARLPIFGLSANVLATDREKAEAAGMNGYLTKPIRKPELSEIVARL
jgi:signal transduction histidine kinase